VTQQAWTGRALYESAGGTISHVRYLGLDVGDRWVGLALGDSESKLSSPLRTFRRSSRRADVETVRKVCATEGVEALVVGLPGNMDGSLGPQAARTMSFAQALQEIGLPVIFCDERLSTAAAESYFTEVRGRRPRPGERVDHIAAALILQDYLNGGAEPDGDLRNGAGHGHDDIGRE
jgi:putative Holliday junction resolvase